MEQTRNPIRRNMESGNFFNRLMKLVRRVVGFNLTKEEVEWVVNSSAELGVRIGGRCFFLYKGHSLVYTETPGYGRERHIDGSPMMVRLVKKREFGECAHPTDWEGGEKYTHGEDWTLLL